MDIFNVAIGSRPTKRVMLWGPVTSGKSGMLAMGIKRVERQALKVLTFVPDAVAPKTSEMLIQTGRDGLAFNAHVYRNIQQATQLVLDTKPDVVFIEESQFVESLAEFLDILDSLKIFSFMTALNCQFNGQPWPVIRDVIHTCNVVQIPGVCHICKSNNALFSPCVDGTQMPANAIAIDTEKSDSTDKYRAACSRCFKEKQYAEKHLPKVGDVLKKDGPTLVYSDSSDDWESDPLLLAAMESAKRKIAIAAGIPVPEHPGTTTTPDEVVVVDIPEDENPPSADSSFVDTVTQGGLMTPALLKKFQADPNLKWVLLESKQGVEGSTSSSEEDDKPTTIHPDSSSTGWPGVKIAAVTELLTLKAVGRELLKVPIATVLHSKWESDLLKAMTAVESAKAQNMAVSVDGIMKLAESRQFDYMVPPAEVTSDFLKAQNETQNAAALSRMQAHLHQEIALGAVSNATGDLFVARQKLRQNMAQSDLSPVERLYQAHTARALRFSLRHPWPFAGKVDPAFTPEEIESMIGMHTGYMNMAYWKKMTADYDSSKPPRQRTGGEAQRDPTEGQVLMISPEGDRHVVASSDSTDDDEPPPLARDPTLSDEEESPEDIVRDRRAMDSLSSSSGEHVIADKASSSSEEKPSATNPGDDEDSGALEQEKTALLSQDFGEKLIGARNTKPFDSSLQTGTERYDAMAERWTSFKTEPMSEKMLRKRMELLAIMAEMDGKSTYPSMKEIINEHFTGAKVVGGDTESTFVQLNPGDTQRILNSAKPTLSFEERAAQMMQEDKEPGEAMRRRWEDKIILPPTTKQQMEAAALEYRVFKTLARKLQRLPKSSVDMVKFNADFRRIEIVAREFHVPIPLITGPDLNRMVEIMEKNYRLYPPPGTIHLKKKAHPYSKIEEAGRAMHAEMEKHFASHINDEDILLAKQLAVLMEARRKLRETPNARTVDVRGQKISAFMAERLGGFVESAFVVGPPATEKFIPSDVKPASTVDIDDVPDLVDAEIPILVAANEPIAEELVTQAEVLKLEFEVDLFEKVRATFTPRKTYQDFVNIPLLPCTDDLAPDNMSDADCEAFEARAKLQQNAAVMEKY
jgi:thymidine kinase